MKSNPSEPTGQPSNKAPESPSPNGWTEADAQRINKHADDFGFQVPYDGTRNFYNTDRVDGFLKGAKYATLYEREQLRAEVESARSELEKLSKFIWDATPPLNRTQIGNTVDSILKLLKP